MKLRAFGRIDSAVPVFVDSTAFSGSSSGLSVGRIKRSEKLNPKRAKLDDAQKDTINLSLSGTKQYVETVLCKLP